MGAQLSEEWIAYWKLSRKVPQGVNQDDFECALADLALAGLRASVKESLTVHSATPPAERRGGTVDRRKEQLHSRTPGQFWRNSSLYYEGRKGHTDRRKGGSGSQIPGIEGKPSQSIPQTDSAPADLAERLRAWAAGEGIADALLDLGLPKPSLFDEAADKIDALAAENAELKAERVGLLGGMKAWKETAESKDRSWAEVLGKKVEEAEAQGHAAGFAEAKGYVAKHVQVMLTACDAGDFGDVEYSRAYVEGIVEEIESLQPRKEAKG